MFRRFFPRKDKGNGSNPENSGQPDTSRSLDPIEAEKARKNIAKFLTHPEVDDGVHRMALRSGKQELPDDPDELQSDLQALAGPSVADLVHLFQGD